MAHALQEVTLLTLDKFGRDGWLTPSTPEQVFRATTPSHAVLDAFLVHIVVDDIIFSAESDCRPTALPSAFAPGLTPLH